MGISVGIVGVGVFGQGFVRLFRDHPQVSRLAICDVRADRLSNIAKRFGIAETYASLDELLASDLEAVAIFTQHWMHAPQAIAALKAGKHAYSAVPIISLTDGDEMLEWTDKLVWAVKQTGVTYMMGETSYYRPQAMYCRRRAKDFGHFAYAEGQYLHDVDLPSCNLRDVLRNRFGGKLDMHQVGDPPMHYPTHSIGGFLSVTGGRITAVSAMGYAMPGDDWHRRDTVSGNPYGNETALFRLSNGGVARVIEGRRYGYVGWEAFSLYGTEASFVEGPGGNFWVTKEKITPVSEEQMRDPLPADVEEAFRRGSASDIEAYGGHGGSHAYLVHEFVDSIVTGRQPAVNVWEAARYFAPGVMAHKSAMKDGELLKVPDWGDAPK
jgi:predicted dehydrogenase